MTWWQFGGLGVAILIVWQLIVYFNGNPRFWRLVGRHPDLALKLFEIERGCLVDTSPPHGNEADYTGPFRFFSADGTTHKVYILDREIKLIQTRVTQALYAAEGRAPHLGIH